MGAAVSRGEAAEVLEAKADAHAGSDAQRGGRGDGGRVAAGPSGCGRAGRGRAGGGARKSAAAPTEAEQEAARAARAEAMNKGIGKRRATARRQLQEREQAKVLNAQVQLVCHPPRHRVAPAQPPAAEPRSQGCSAPHASTPAHGHGRHLRLVAAHTPRPRRAERGGGGLGLRQFQRAAQRMLNFATWKNFRSWRLAANAQVPRRPPAAQPAAAG
jgi:hypothetical protein